MARLIAALAVGICMAWSVPAAAEDRSADPGSAAAPAGEVIGLLSVTSTDVPEAVRVKFEKTIEEGLASLGHPVAPRQRLGELLAGSSWVEGCFFGPCLAEVFRITEVRLVLVARVRSFGPSYAIVLSLVDTRTGLPTSQVAQRCEVCTVDEAASQISLGVIELATGTGDASVADLRAGPTGSIDIVDLNAQYLELRATAEARRLRVRRVGVFFTSVALIGGAAAVYFMSSGDDDELSTLLAVGAVSSAIAGTTMFALSRKF